MSVKSAKHPCPGYFTHKYPNRALFCIRCGRARLRKPRDPDHGLSNTLAYFIWAQMRYRCNSKDCPAYKWYGGRGIKVCERWNESFLYFLKDMGDPGKGMSIERKDNNGPYSPKNCRWIPRLHQRLNTRATHVLTFDGVTKPLSHWAKDLRIRPSSLRARLSRGASVEKAVTTPRCEASYRAGIKAAALQGHGAFIKRSQKRWKKIPRRSISPLRT